jgi:hypothetical protein
MDVFVDLLKILLPALIVLYAMYLTMRSILVKELEKKMVDYKIENARSVLKNRLQAYERIALFLERIAPNNLLLRLNNPKLSAVELQRLLTFEIREEYNHNLSQQIYMGDATWNMVKNAMEDVIAMVNTCAEGLEKDAKSVELARAVLEESGRRERDIIQEALAAVKEEIREIF